MKYRYDHFDRKLMMEDMAWHGGVEVGHPLPDFDLPTTDGTRVRRSDFVGVRPLLLTFGSFTCPMTMDADVRLKGLYAQFKDQVAFLTLYVREAHPGEAHPQPATLEQKMRFARELKVRDALPWPVAVDDLDGALHQALDPKPNAAYVMDQHGRVAFRSLWSNDRESVLRAALSDVLSGTSPNTEHSGRLVPLLRGVGKMDRVLSLAGETARRDVRRQAPPVYLMARLASLTRRSRDPRVAASAGTG